MNFLCDSCRFRQENLDPEGCWKEVSTTGYLGKLWMNIVGCYKYKMKDDIK